MNRSNKSDDGSLLTDALTQGDPAKETASRAASEKRTLPVQGTETQENAARIFSVTHDEASFTVLYRAVQQPMTAAVRRAHILASDIEDVVSIAGAALWFGRESFKGQTYGQFVAFATTTAYSKALDWHKANRRYNRRVVRRKGSEESYFDAAVEPSPGPDAIAIAREALGKLAPQERTVLRMHVEGWTFDEIGKAIGLGEDRARQIYHGAIARLERMR